MHDQVEGAERMYGPVRVDAYSRKNLVKKYSCEDCILLAGMRQQLQPCSYIDEDESTKSYLMGLLWEYDWADLCLTLLLMDFDLHLSLNLRRQCSLSSRWYIIVFGF